MKSESKDTKKSRSRKEIVAELAAACGMSANQIESLFRRMAQMVAAEADADRGFTIPDLCRFKIVTRRPRRFRNPRTGRMLLVGERRVVKITPIKSLKDAAGSRGTVQEVEPAARADRSTQSPHAPHPPAPAPFLLVAQCTHCGAEVEAEEQDAGMEAPCPSCGKPIKLPTLHDKAPAGSAPDNFLCFKCHVCHQDIEAVSDLVGKEIPCPSCGTDLVVPLHTETPAAKDDEIPPLTPEQEKGRDTKTLRAMMGRTMRIELPRDL